MALRQCFFFDTPEMTKIVIPKIIQNFKLYLLAQGTEPKRFFFFLRETYNTGRDFFGIVRIFRSFATELMLKNPKGPSLSVLFRHCEFFSNRMDRWAANGKIQSFIQ